MYHSSLTSQEYDGTFYLRSDYRNLPEYKEIVKRHHKQLTNCKFPYSEGISCTDKTIYYVAQYTVELGSTTLNEELARKILAKLN